MTDTLSKDDVQTMIDEAVAGLNDKLVEREKKISDLEVALKKADDETSRIAANRDQILKEKRQLENREPRDKTADDFAITREEARNPEIYRRAKAKANEAGFELKVIDDAPSIGQAPERFENDETIFVSHSKVREGGPEFYRALKAEAEKAGQGFHIVTALEHWPKEAFQGATNDA